MTRTILDHIGNTPLVELTQIGRGLRNPILVKCEHMSPGGSVKDRIALAIVDDAEKRGVLRQGMTMVEATAGNTGIGLALVAARRGYGLVCVMPEKMAHEKRFALAALRAKVVITPNAPPSSPENFRRVAERLAVENGWFLTDQFRSPANVRVHEETTAREILEQTGRRVGAFEGIGGSEPPELLDRSVIHAAESVSDAESFEMARRLAHEEGLFVGGSAGTNVAAAMRVAQRADVDGPVVTVLPDGWDRYRGTAWMKAWPA